MCVCVGVHARAEAGPHFIGRTQGIDTLYLDASVSNGSRMIFLVKRERRKHNLYIGQGWGAHV
jgi:hypothetical protein